MRYSCNASPLCFLLLGLTQAISPFMSFKVMPELDDAGYYSDKAVLSRNFVHENIFFTLMVVFGSVYYHESGRAKLRASYLGQFLEVLSMFWPYVLLRTWFPITSFKDVPSPWRTKCLPPIGNCVPSVWVDCSAT